MLRVLFQYEGKNKGAPSVAIEAQDEDEAVEQFCEMKKAKLRRFAMKDWIYDCYPVRSREQKPLLVRYTAQ